ncbi:MAG: hypothetical protein RML34_00855 [Leptospiraceae bacterium]|nr:hypothetical protein [Leptospiraceae bacterium]
MRWLWCALPLTLLACVQDEVLLHPPGGRAFWTLSIRESYRTKQVLALYSGHGHYAEAYVALDVEISPELINYVLDEFDHKIAPRLHALFTQPLDIDQNGKIVLLFLDIDDGYTTGGGYISGYFDALNQFDDRSVKEITGRRSNEMEIIYLDTYPSEVGSVEFLATLAHEYQHLLQFSHNYRYNSDEEKWVDEGLSEIASDLTGYGPQIMRLVGFRQIGNGPCGSHGCLIGDSLISWDGNIADYNHVYVYFRYLADALGEAALQAIFRETESDLTGMESALAKIGLSTSCGGVAPGYQLGYMRFLCSYRYLWGAILGTSELKGSTGSMDFPSQLSLPGHFRPGHNPRQSLFPGDTGGIPAYSVGHNVLSLYPYTFTYYSHNANHSPPKLSNFGCPSCEIQKFSLIYNNQHFVIFNHHPEATPSSTKLIDPRLAIEPEISVREEPSYGVRKALVDGYPLHFYQKVPLALRQKLWQQDP